ncbi:MAG: phage/plasmid primase, P4 family [Lachnospiraceae bacterium]
MLKKSELMEKGVPLDRCRNLNGEPAFGKVETTKQINLGESKNHALTPIPQSLPAEMGPAQIYQPEKIDEQQFLKKEPETVITASKIYRELLSLYKIKVFEDEIYIFAPREGRYIKVSNLDLDRLINRHFGRAIEKNESLWCYYNAKEFIIRDYQLVVTKENFLPPEYWAFRNGLCNIYTEELIPNEGQFFLRNVLQCEYDPHAKCPTFERYIASVSGGDEAIANLLCEVWGYLLSRDTNGKVFFDFYGKKDTGKSLQANILAEIIGEDAISNLAAAEFSGRFDVAELNGKHINICMDLPDRPLSPDAVGKIKSITGNDVVRSDVKYKDAIKFKPTARLLFGSNAQIRTEIFDPAFNERLIMVPFLYPVPKEKQDFYLKEKLLQEKAGICNKVMEAYKRLKEKSYRFTTVSVPEQISPQIDYETVIRCFAMEQCEFTDNENDKLSSSSLFHAFETFCAGKFIPPIDQIEFSKTFRILFVEKVEKKKIKENGESVQGFTKIKLK